VGELVSIDDPKMQAKAVFTNRAGRFVVTGLSPGRYRLIAGPDKLTADFVVKEDDEGIIDIGKLSLRIVT
jgi:outer membrane usher protein